MLTSDSREFYQYVHQNELNWLGRASSKTMCRAMLVSPEGFAISAQAATDNPYMSGGSSTVVDMELAMNQHRNVVEAIERMGVEVVGFPGVKGQPDGIFPNNVFATAEKQLIIGRMFHPERRKEAERLDIREHFAGLPGWGLKDLSISDEVAELTGMLVIDHARNIGFCAVGNRCTQLGAESLYRAFGLNALLSFGLNRDEYHTNIVLSVLAGRACVYWPQGFAAVSAAGVAEVLQQLYGENAIAIDEDEKNAFVGNCLALNEQTVIMSQKAEQGLNDSTRRSLEAAGFQVISSDISELEKGGGSMRCLIAEVFE